ncbi:hypothetical protein [Bradyrhizobium genosp. A]|uniref:hypothetical protein n=1 Tax=Bradyrhizobium genosp. A TaxID=83626 RepID=UPI003CEC2257
MPTQPDDWSVVSTEPAKPPFDPDAYLASQPAAVAGQQRPNAQFDPDAYLASPPTPSNAGGWNVVSQEPSNAPSMSWSDVGSQALRNTPASAVQFGHDIIQPFIHPVDTATNLKNLGLGVLDKAGLGSGEHAQYADAVGRFYADRYGGVENVKRAFANDPVGVLGDLSILLTGGESALARAPGIVGKAGEIAGAAGRAIDPINNAARAGSALAKGAGYVGAEGLGLTTGVGAEPIRLAARSGYEGGEAGSAFRENMRGQAPMGEAVDDARKAVGQMRQERGNAYRQAMQDIGMDRTILNFDEVDDAMRKAGGVNTFKGQDISPSTQSIRHQLADVIDEWRSLDPAEYHTAEGFDALKQKVGSIRDATQYGTPERLVADRAYQGIRRTIVDQAPDYAKAMNAYQEASDLIKEMEKTLSINPKASVDTTLRKLQSVLRDNVTTAYGRRAELADYLVNAGAPRLMEKLAGQSLGSWMPRGWGRLVATELPAMAAGALGAGTAGAGAGALATLPAMSPRLVGEAAHGAGRAARQLGRVATPLSVLPVRTARQLGRLPQNNDQVQ